MRELGIEVPDARGVRLGRWERLQARLAPVERLIARQEAMENEIAAQIEEEPTGDPRTDALLDQIKAEEEDAHGVARAAARAQRRARAGKREPG